VEDLVLPTAMWVEKEGAYGNAERRTQFWREQVTAPGEAKSDLWQIMEFAKRFKAGEVWPQGLVDKKPEYRGKTLYEILFANGTVDKFPYAGKILDDRGNEYRNHESEHFGYYVQKDLFEEYRLFNSVPDIPKKGHEMPPFDTYHNVRGQRWPVIDGKERPCGASEVATTPTWWVTRRPSIFTAIRMVGSTSSYSGSTPPAWSTS